MFITENMGVAAATYHQVDRSKILTSVVQLFNQTGVAEEFPLRIRFVGEISVDVGGVYREMLSAFWDEAYVKLFDGGNLLAPCVHPQIELSVFPVLGKVLSHGYLESGFLPVKIAFPTLAAILLRTIDIEDKILASSFFETVSVVEANLLHKVLNLSSISESQKVKVVSILSRFGSRQVPTLRSLPQQIADAARYEFLLKPSVALKEISSGIPDSHLKFWSTITLKNFHVIYLASSASAEIVLDQLIEPDILDVNQERIFEYLRLYIGNMENCELRRFLRFVTGSSVCSSEGIRVSLTNCQGLKDVQLGIRARHCLNYRLVTSRMKSLCKSSELFSVLVIGSWMQFDI